jgi:glycosyltransferase involved in cell wall biosynthesis
MDPLPDSKARPTFSVVIPVHNEADYLPEALVELFQELATVAADTTVLIAENGSTDGTADEVKKLMQQYPSLSLISLPTPDYGAAMRDGFLATTGDWAVNFDIDYFSGDFLNTVLEVGIGADIVLASKRAEGADDRRSPFRRFGTWTFNQILQFGLGSEVSDTHGMKAVRRSVVSDVVPRVRSTQDLFDTELVVRAERAGYRIVEVPAVVEEKRATKTGLITRVPRTLRGIAAIRKTL